MADAGAGQAGPVQFNPKEPDKDTYIRIKEMDLESGLLGKLFGSAKNAPVNIAGAAMVMALSAGMVMTLTKDGASATESWKIIAPIVTMILGFIFGKRS